MNQGYIFLRHDVLMQLIVKKLFRIEILYSRFVTEKV